MLAVWPTTVSGSTATCLFSSTTVNKTTYVSIIHKYTYHHATETSRDEEIL